MSHRLSRIFARFVGLSFTILGIWIFAVSMVNINDMSDSGGVLVWVITASALGAIGGILFLLSFDGPARFQTRKIRRYGWIGMVVLGLLPWSFWFVMLPLVLLAGLTLSGPASTDRPNQPTTA